MLLVVILLLSSGALPGCRSSKDPEQEVLADMNNETQRPPTTEPWDFSTQMEEAGGGGQGPGMSQTMIRLFARLMKANDVYTVICTVFPVLAIVFNGLSILVFSQKKRRSQSVSILLVALAITDTLSLYPQIDFILYLHSGKSLMQSFDAGCRIGGYIYGTCRMCSTYFIVIFTVERFISVRYPLKRITLCTKRRLTIAMLSTIGAALALMSYIPVVQGSHPERHTCMIKPEYGWLLKYMTPVALYGIGFFLPALAIAVLNGFLIKAMLEWTAKRAELSNDTNKEKTNAANRSLTVMLVTVSSFSMLTVMPKIVADVIVRSMPPATTGYTPMHMHAMIAGYYLDMLQMLNYTCNFFFYCLSGRQFRMEFLALITCGRVGVSKTVSTITKTTGVTSDISSSGTAAVSTISAVPKA